MGGGLFDSYAAGLRHGRAEVPEGAWCVGVVRRGTPWFYSEVDENLQELGAPGWLLDAAKDRTAALEAEGVDGADAHNQAFEDVDFPGEYRAYLEESEEAQAEVDRVIDRLEEGRDVVLVCYENTDEKRCHRIILKAYIQEQIDGS